MSDPIIPPDATVVIVPPPPMPEEIATALNQALRRAADLEQQLSIAKTQLLEASGMIDGLQMTEAAAKRERDAARLALDASLLEPCSICGKQRKDTP